jgi:hypothetical protein
MSAVLFSEIGLVTISSAAKAENDDPAAFSLSWSNSTCARTGLLFFFLSTQARPRSLVVICGGRDLTVARADVASTAESKHLRLRLLRFLANKMLSRYPTSFGLFFFFGLASSSSSFSCSTMSNSVAAARRMSKIASEYLILVASTLTPLSFAATAAITAETAVVEKATKGGDERRRETRSKRVSSFVEVSNFSKLLLPTDLEKKRKKITFLFGSCTYKLRAQS